MPGSIEPLTCWSEIFLSKHPLEHAQKHPSERALKNLSETSMGKCRNTRPTQAQEQAVQGARGADADKPVVTSFVPGTAP